MLLEALKSNAWLIPREQKKTGTTRWMRYTVAKLLLLFFAIYWKTINIIGFVSILSLQFRM